jgi:monoamine oxidase
LVYNRWDNDEVISDIDHVIEQGAGKGYTGVLNYYAAPFADRVRYNSLVTSINWSSSSNAVVTYSNYGSTSTVNAKKVIVTVPLGVLQKGSINFTPALPTWKSTAINKLGMGTYNKIILQWNDDDTLPWPNVEWIEKISKLGDQGHWTEFFKMKPTTGKQVLVAFSAG